MCKHLVLVVVTRLALIAMFGRFAKRLPLLLLCQLQRQTSKRGVAESWLQLCGINILDILDYRNH